MAIKKKKTKRTTARVAKSGIGAVPFAKGFDYVVRYFHENVDKKDISDLTRGFVKKNYSKADAKNILANPEYSFNMFTHHGATVYWSEIVKTDAKYDGEVFQQYLKGFKTYLSKINLDGAKIVKEKEFEKKLKGNVVTLSPMQRLQNKINNTIMQDLLTLEDEWIDGQETTLDLYNQFKSHGLSGSATIPVRAVVEGWLLDYEDAYLKRCADAVEGYSHLKKSELNRRVKACKDMLEDLDKIKSATKSLRKVRIKKPQSAIKQVAKLKYQKEDTNFKLVSTNPLNVIGSARLYVFNTKYKRLAEYVTQDPKGFIISGSTIKNFDKEASRECTLRSSQLGFIQTVTSKTPNQVDKAWSETLKTKVTSPNGRINDNIILLRTVNK